MIKKVVVTGANGFIGRYCLPLLVQNGYEVHAISTTRQMESPGIIWHQINLFDFSVVQNLFAQLKPQYVLHLAWYTEHGKFWRSTHNLKWVQASLELAQIFAQQGGKKFVAAGTCAEYEWSGDACQEDKTPLIPSTLYGCAKNSLRAIFENFFAQEKIEFCWGRIFYPYGPGEKGDRLIPALIRAFLSGQPAKCTAGDQLRDFLFIEDVAGIFVALLESKCTGAINIGSGEVIAVKDVCRIIAESLNASHLLQLGAIPNPSHDTIKLVADVKKLKQELQWSPQISLEAGLKHTIAWWQNEVYAF